MKEYIKIELDNANIKCTTIEDTNNVSWLKDHCLEKDESITDGEVHNFYFKFGSNDSSTDFRTSNFDITRLNILDFLEAYFSGIWENGDFHIDSLWFASDGDEDDCQYVVKAEVYKE